MSLSLPLELCLSKKFLKEGSCSYLASVPSHSTVCYGLHYFLVNRHKQLAYGHLDYSTISIAQTLIPRSLIPPVASAGCPSHWVTSSSISSRLFRSGQPCLSQQSGFHPLPPGLGDLGASETLSFVNMVLTSAQALTLRMAISTGIVLQELPLASPCKYADSFKPWGCFTLKIFLIILIYLTANQWGVPRVSTCKVSRLQ